jgi:hypothetical protein
LNKNFDEACKWLKKAIYLDGKFLEEAQKDGDFDALKRTNCFNEIL